MNKQIGLCQNHLGYTYDKQDIFVYTKSSIANYYGHRDKHRCVALNQYEMCLKQLSKKKNGTFSIACVLIYPIYCEVTIPSWSTGSWLT